VLTTPVVNIEMEPSVGNSELRLLRFIAERGPLTVRSAHEGFQQMMERLRKKGLLARRDDGDGFQYFAVEAPHEIARTAVHQFVTQALGGSLTPLVSYLAEQTQLTEADRKELADLLEQLK
jgi:BlaI family transcriptional regulator, penicillinase repressor